MRPYVRVVLGVLSTFAAGLVGVAFVDSGTARWYEALIKPAFTPPEWVFGLVWAFLYVAMAGALCIIWLKPSKSTEGWVRFYFVQLLFSAAWIMFFFGLHAVLIAFIDILFLGSIVLGLIVEACEHDRRAMYFLLPYFCWIVFTGYFTLNVWLLN